MYILVLIKPHLFLENVIYSTCYSSTHTHTYTQTQTHTPKKHKSINMPGHSTHTDIQTSLHSLWPRNVEVVVEGEQSKHTQYQFRNAQGHCLQSFKALHFVYTVQGPTKCTQTWWFYTPDSPASNGLILNEFQVRLKCNWWWWITEALPHYSCLETETITWVFTVTVTHKSLNNA